MLGGARGTVETCLEDPEENWPGLARQAGRSGGGWSKERRVDAENRDKIGPGQACCIAVDGDNQWLHYCNIALVFFAIVPLVPAGKACVRLYALLSLMLGFKHL